MEHNKIKGKSKSCNLFQNAGLDCLAVNFRNVMLILCVFGILVLASIQKTEAQTLSFYLKEAAENNPALKSYYHNYLAELEKVPQAGALPDPEISVGLFVQNMETLMGNQRMEASLMQMFPWFGMLKIQKEEASWMAKAEYQGYVMAKTELYYQVRTAYYQLLLNKEDQVITELHLDILRSLERLSINALQAGTAGAVSQESPVVTSRDNTGNPNKRSMSMGQNSAPGSGSAGVSSMAQSMGSSGQGIKLSDIYRIQIQIQELETKLEQLEENYSTLTTGFNLLLNKESRDEIALDNEVLDAEIVLDKKLVLDSIMGKNPALIMLDAENETFRKQQEMAKKESKPMLGVGVNYMVFNPRMPTGEIGGNMGYVPGGMGNNMVMPMVSMTLPIYRKKNKAAAKEAEWKQVANQDQRENTKNDLLFAWEESYRRIRETERNLGFYEKQVELLEKTLDLMLTEFANEGGTIESIFSVQRQLLDFRLKRIQEKVNKQTAIAELEMLMARDY